MALWIWKCQFCCSGAVAHFYQAAEGQQRGSPASSEGIPHPVWHWEANVGARNGNKTQILFWHGWFSSSTGTHCLGFDVAAAPGRGVLIF